jgi:lipopolysaccharide export system protein LptC
MSPRQILFIGLLALLLVGSQMLLRQTPESVAEEPPADRGYYAVDATLRGLAEGGDALIEISVDRAEQQPELARVALQQVDVTYVDREAIPWRMRADAGHITADWELLELRGDVRLERLDDAIGQPLSLVTDHLTVLVSARRASTQSLVRLEGPRGVLTGRGMTADLQAQRFELEAQVHGRFQRSPGTRAEHMTP